MSQSRNKPAVQPGEIERILDWVERYFGFLPDDIEQGLKEALDSLPDNLESAEGLEFCEDQIRFTADKSGFYRTLAAYFSYIVLSNRLWQFELDDEGQPVFQGANDYIKRRLTSICGLGKTVIWEDYNGLRLAFENNLGPKTIDDVVGLGGVQTFSRPAKLLGEEGAFNRGRLGDLPVDVPSGQTRESYIMGVIEKAAVRPGEDTTPQDAWNTLRSHFSPRPQIRLEAYIPTGQKHGRRGILFAWSMEWADPNSGEITRREEGYLHEEAPPEVRAFACRRLSTSDPYPREES